MNMKSRRDVCMYNPVYHSSAHGPSHDSPPRNVIKYLIIVGSVLGFSTLYLASRILDCKV